MSDEILNKKFNQKEYQKQWVKENIEYLKKYHKDYYTRNRSRYWRSQGIKLTIEEFDTLFIKQDGKCILCGVTQDKLKKALFVDHSHKTGKIRGLLCTKCNFNLGVIENFYLPNKLQIDLYLREK